MVHLGKRWEQIQRLEIAAAVKIAVGVARVVAAAEEASEISVGHVGVVISVFQVCSPSAEEQKRFADLVGVPVSPPCSPCFGATLRSEPPAGFGFGVGVS